MTEPSFIDPFPSPATRKLLASIAQLASTHPFDPTRRERARAVVSYGHLRKERLPGDELLDAPYRLLDSVSKVADGLGDDKVASPEDMAVYRWAAIYTLWDEQGVEDEVGDHGIRAQEQVPAQDPTREEIGGTREDGAGQAHGQGSYDSGHDPAVLKTMVVDRGDQSPYFSSPAMPSRARRTTRGAPRARLRASSQPACPPTLCAEAGGAVRAAPACRRPASIPRPTLSASAAIPSHWPLGTGIHAGRPRRRAIFSSNSFAAVSGSPRISTLGAASPSRSTRPCPWPMMRAPRGEVNRAGRWRVDKHPQRHSLAGPALRTGRPAGSSARPVSANLPLVDPPRSSPGMLVAPPHAGASGALRLPAHAPHGRPAAAPPLDEHLVQPETRDQLIRGRRVLAMPSNPPHGDQHFKLDYVIGAHVKAGYVGSTDLLTRSAASSDFATDTCIRRDGIDPETKARYLEELAFEVVNEQSLRDVTDQAEDLIARGVRRVVAIFVKKGEVCEWSAKQGTWKTLDPEGTFTDPTLARPLRVKELIDAAEADNAVARALLAKDNPVLAEVKTASRAEGEKKGLAEGEEKGLIEGRREAITLACELLGIELGADQRARMNTLDASGLEALLGVLRTERRFA